MRLKSSNGGQNDVRRRDESVVVQASSARHSQEASDRQERQGLRR